MSEEELFDAIFPEGTKVTKGEVVSFVYPASPGAKQRDIRIVQGKPKGFKWISGITVPGEGEGGK